MRLDGLATGMDTRNVIEQLMEVEREPIEEKEHDIAEKQEMQELWRDVRKDIKSFEDAFSNLQNKETFEAVNLSSDNDNIQATDASPEAEGNFNVDVYQVAQKHAVQSDAIEDIEDLDDDLLEEGAISEGEFEIGLNGDDNNDAEYTTVSISNENDQVELTFEYEDEEKEDVTVSLDELTLEDLARELDENIDNVNIRTRSVNDDYYLHFEGAEYGRDLYLEDVDNSILEDDLGIIENGDIHDDNELQEAQYADFKIDGMNFDDHEGNTVEIDGVTIDISGAEPNGEEDPDTATITVERDLDSVRESIDNFIESYNQIKERIEELGGEEGPLQGDSTLNMLENRLRRAVSDTVPVDNENAENDDEGLVPANFGIEFDTDPERSGYLLTSEEENFSGDNIGNIIDEKLTDGENIEELKTLFADEEHGIANRLQEEADLFLRGEADLIDSRIDNIDSEIDRTGDRIERREERIERREERLWMEFTRMEQAIQEMHAMREGMQNQMNQLQAMGQQ